MKLGLRDIFVNKTECDLLLCKDKLLTNYETKWKKRCN